MERTWNDRVQVILCMRDDARLKKNGFENCSFLNRGVRVYIILLLISGTMLVCNNVHSCCFGNHRESPITMNWSCSLFSVSSRSVTATRLVGLCCYYRLALGIFTSRLVIAI